MTSVSFAVYGQPAPQGNHRVSRHGAVYETSKAHKPWREAVKSAARDAMEGHDSFEGPLFVEVVFTFTRPRGHFGTGRNATVLKDSAPMAPMTMASKDIDKLLRSTFDACTDAGVWRDDCQVAALSALKVWAKEHPQALDVAGAWMKVTPLTHRYELLSAAPTRFEEPGLWEVS